MVTKRRVYYTEDVESLVTAMRKDRSINSAQIRHEDNTLMASFECGTLLEDNTLMASFECGTLPEGVTACKVRISLEEAPVLLKRLKRTIEVHHIPYFDFTYQKDKLYLSVYSAVPMEEMDYIRDTYYDLVGVPIVD